MLIITDRCYIHADRVHHISVDENIDWHHDKEDKSTSKHKTYCINIYYVKEDPSGKNSREEENVTIDIVDQEKAEKTYLQILEQVREQSPDPAHMEKLVEKYILGDGDDGSSV